MSQRYRCRLRGPTARRRASQLRRPTRWPRISGLGKLVGGIAGRCGGAAKSLARRKGLNRKVRTPAVSVRRSVHRDYVVCRDCGYRGKTLRRHISTRHGLSPDEYRRRWGLRSNDPLTAPVYSEHRSTMARARGFGRRLATPAAPVGTPKESPAVVSTAGTAKAKSARRSRPVSKSNVAGKVAAPMPARRRRSRAPIASPSI
jgi:predicted transcriptional regulator